MTIRINMSTQVNTNVIRSTSYGGMQYTSSHTQIFYVLRSRVCKMTSQRNGCSISTSPVHLSTEALLLWLCSFAQQLVEAKNVAESDSMCFGMVDF